LIAAISPSSWTPLTLLAERFHANIQALASRYPSLADGLRSLIPSQTYYIQPNNGQLLLGVSRARGIEPLPQIVQPQRAYELTNQLYPKRICNVPAMITGEDLGWLWNSVYQLPCGATAAAPGYRPPLYFLLKDIERLWVILHVQDWQTLLADSRVRLFVGLGAFDQFRRVLVEDAMCPWPKLSMTVDPSLWPAGLTIDAVLTGAYAGMIEKLSLTNQQLRNIYDMATPESFAALYSSGKPLKILGITSRYTTFLQYSMRDWLAAFDRLGHCTRLFIEGGDHEVPNNLALAIACAEFKPDLIVVIDHYRREMEGLPEEVPVVMWVQDALTTLFCDKAGAAQGDRDYSLGFARLRMIHEFGYPADRYMPAVVGVNEQRFAPRQLSPAEQTQFACDVSFVSHANTPAEAILKAEVDRLNSAPATRLLSTIFDQLRAVYDGGGIVTEPVVIRAMVDRSMRDTQTTLPPEQMPSLMDLFTQRINNALFRHQSLNWLAEMGVDLRLYGRGWEKHPTLHRFARGVADNVNQLSLIYQASKINLQVSPHGAVHQRVLEGLASGGFFLIRHCPGDVVERDFRAIRQWCIEQNITNDDDLRRRATVPVKAHLAAVTEAMQLDPFAGEYPFVDVLRASEEAGYIRSAGCVWGDDYDAICYRSAKELRARVEHYLSNDEDRRQRAESMRRAVCDRFTYLAITRRLLDFVAGDLTRNFSVKVAA
jgi:hypothetical protein